MLLTDAEMSLTTVILITELENAATKIQASFRGHMVRKQMGKNESNGEPSTSKVSCSIF